MVAGMCATSAKRCSKTTSGAPQKKAKASKPQPEQPEEEYEEEGIAHGSEEADQEEEDKAENPKATASPKAKAKAKANPKAKADPKAKANPKAKAKPSALKTEWAKFLAEHMKEHKGEKPVSALMKDAAEKCLAHFFLRKVFH